MAWFKLFQFLKTVLVPSFITFLIIIKLTNTSVLTDIDTAIWGSAISSRSGCACSREDCYSRVISCVRLVADWILLPSKLVRAPGKPGCPGLWVSWVKAQPAAASPYTAKGKGSWRLCSVSSAGVVGGRCWAAGGCVALPSSCIWLCLPRGVQGQGLKAPGRAGSFVSSPTGAPLLSAPGEIPPQSPSVGCLSSPVLSVSFRQLVPIVLQFTQFSFTAHKKQTYSSLAVIL